MSLQSSLLVAFGLLGGLSLAATQKAPDREPPLELVLVIDEMRLNIAVGEDFEFKLGETTHRGNVIAKPSRSFHKSGIHFRYPSDFIYEFDDEIEGCDVYTMEGPETLIMMQVYEGELDLQEVVDVTIEAVMEDLQMFDVEVIEHELSLGTGNYNSTQLKIFIEEEGLGFTQDYFAFPCSEGTGVGCIQYGYGDEMEMSAESARAKRLLTSSFEVDAPK